MAHSITHASTHTIHVYDHDISNKLSKIGEHSMNATNAFIAFDALTDKLNQSDEWVINTESISDGDSRGIIIMGVYQLTASRCFWMDGFIESFNVGLKLDPISLTPLAVTIAFSNNAEHDLDCLVEINGNKLASKSTGEMVALINAAVDKIIARIPLVHPIQAFNPKTYKHDPALLEDIVTAVFRKEISRVRVVGFRLNSDYSSPIFIVGFNENNVLKKIDVNYDEYLEMLSVKQKNTTKLGR